jgi:hypothetical protein
LGIKRANLKKIVFGSRELFEQLKKKTLNRQKKRDTKTKMGGKKVWHFIFKRGQITTG